MLGPRINGDCTHVLMFIKALMITKIFRKRKFSNEPNLACKDILGQNGNKPYPYLTTYP
jgi:hypothetical protein